MAFYAIRVTDEDNQKHALDVEGYDIQIYLQYLSVTKQWIATLTVNDVELFANMAVVSGSETFAKSYDKRRFKLTTLSLDGYDAQELDDFTYRTTLYLEVTQ